MGGLTTAGGGLPLCPDGTFLRVFVDHSSCNIRRSNDIFLYREGRITLFKMLDAPRTLG